MNSKRPSSSQGRGASRGATLIRPSCSIVTADEPFAGAAIKKLTARPYTLITVVTPAKPTGRPLT